MNLSSMTEEAISRLAESLGIAVEKLTEIINNATDYINSQQENKSQTLEDMLKELEQGYIVPSDETNIETKRF